MFSCVTCVIKSPQQLLSRLSFPKRRRSWECALKIVHQFCSAVLNSSAFSTLVACSSNLRLRLPKTFDQLAHAGSVGSLGTCKSRLAASPA